MANKANKTASKATATATATTASKAKSPATTATKLALTPAQKLAQACKLYAIPQTAPVTITRYNGKPINKQVATAAFMAVAVANGVPITTKLFGTAYNVFGLCYKSSGALATQFTNGNTRMYCHYGNMATWQAQGLSSKYIGQFTLALGVSVTAIAKLQGVTPQTVKTALIKATKANTSLNQLATAIKVA